MPWVRKVKGRYGSMNGSANFNTLTQVLVYGAEVMGRIFRGVPRGWLNGLGGGRSSDPSHFIGLRASGSGCIHSAPSRDTATVSTRLPMSSPGTHPPTKLCGTSGELGWWCVFAPITLVMSRRRVNLE